MPGSTEPGICASGYTDRVTTPEDGSQPARIEPTVRPRLDGADPTDPDSAPATPTRAAEAPQEKRRGGCFSETLTVLVVALALSVIVKTFFVQTFFIPSPSMESTLMVDDRIIVNKLADSEGELHRGDIVVFVDPGGWLDAPATQQSGFQKFLNDALTFVGILPQHAGEHLIKRVIGLPGDQVTCCTEDGLLSVNGVPITEPYLNEGAVPSEMDFDVVVPAGHLWVMGDNRQDSRDSRAHLGNPGGGFVPIENVEGRASHIVFPFDRMGWLGGADANFADVP